MKQPNQGPRNVKNTITAAQAKKRLAIGTGVPLDFPSPCIALFPEGDGDSGAGGISEEVIDLSASEYAALKRAGARGHAGVLMFMANAALEKAGWPPRTVTCVLLEPNGREWARVKFPRDVFARIEAAARKLHISLGRFFYNAMRHYIKLLMARRSA